MSDLSDFIAYMRTIASLIPTTEPAPGSSVRAPVLVYGTLREGERNSMLLRGRGRALGATRVSGVRMYDNSGMYPYAALASDPRHEITVEVVQVSEPRWRETLRDLDLLEGFWGHGVQGNHYTRLPWRWSLQDAPGEYWGWLYVASQETEREIAARRMRVIRHGDWLDR